MHDWLNCVHPDFVTIKYMTSTDYMGTCSYHNSMHDSIEIYSYIIQTFCHDIINTHADRLKVYAA